MATNRRKKNRAIHYKGYTEWDHMFGRCYDKPDAPSLEQLRDEWLIGGAYDYIMRWQASWRPGFRPQSWWLWTFPDEHKAEVESKPLQFPDEMTILEHFGYADEAERRAYDEDQRWRAEVERISERNAGARA